MNFRLYKEGQGVWARGTLAFILLVTGILASTTVFDWAAESGWSTAAWFTVPIFNWSIQPAVVLSTLALVPFFLMGIWLYNHKRLADFMIETEVELKTKVTWPTRKEAYNNSIVVIIGCIILGTWVALIDTVLRSISNFMYQVDM